MAKIPLISIGIPTYNRPDMLKKALACLCRQTYSNLEIIVSDNCSPDENVKKVVLELQNSDDRIKYFRQQENIHFQNFFFVLAQATGQYFMWAADDDEWNENFIEVCLNNLIEKKVGVSFCGIENIDTYSQKIRDYPMLHKLSGPPNIGTILNYLMNHEYLGKANIIYGIYEIEFCRQNVERMKHYMNGWGADMSFNLGVIARGGVYIDPKVLFHKRIEREIDSLGNPAKITVEKLSNYICPLRDFYHYSKSSLAAVKGTKFYGLTLCVMTWRLLLVVFSHWTLKIHNSCRRLKRFIF